MSTDSNTSIDFTPIHKKLSLANQDETKITGAGNVNIVVRAKGCVSKISLNEVMYVSGLRKNLMRCAFP